MEDRRLAAIMFTDIVGYTALMGSDEKKAFEVLRKNRNIQKPIIKKYRGKWLKEMGDGILASFDTASDAVRCAGEIQIQAKKENIELRIGIHTGEVVFEGNDVLGDGVNVASRLEELAEKGCIYISGSVYKDIKNKEGIKADFIEEKNLKNVDEPVRIYRVECEEEIQIAERGIELFIKKRLKYFIIPALAVIVAIILIRLNWSKEDLKNQKSETISEIKDKTIAVLPFFDDSPGKDNEYFCNGMMEEILDRLQKIADLNVKSRSAVEKYRNSDRDINIIGDELEVAYLIEGSVRKSGDDLRITAQLIDAKSGDHLWSEVYDGKYTDKIFDFQSDLAKKIASSLEVIITPREENRIEEKSTTNMVAHDLALKGSDYIRRYYATGDSQYLIRANNLFDQIQKIDPENPNYLSGKSRIFRLSGNYDSAIYYVDQLIKNFPERGYTSKGIILALFMNKPREALPYLMKGIDITPNDPWTNLAIGQYYYFTDFNLDSALTYYQKAYNSGGNTQPEINGMIGRLFLDIGLYSKSIKYYEQALKYAANSDQECMYAISLNDILLCQGKFDKSQLFLDSICGIIDCELQCYRNKMIILYFQKKFQKAEEIYRIIKEERTFDPSDSIDLAFIYKKQGREKESLDISNTVMKTIERGVMEYETYYYLKLELAAIYAIMDDKNKAIQYISKAVEDGLYDGWHDLIGIYPPFESLTGNTVFKSLVKKAQEEKAALRAHIEEMEERGELNL